MIQIPQARNQGRVWDVFIVPGVSQMYSLFLFCLNTWLCLCWHACALVVPGSDPQYEFIFASAYLPAYLGQLVESRGQDRHNHSEGQIWHQTLLTLVGYWVLCCRMDGAIGDLKDFNNSLRDELSELKQYLHSTYDRLEKAEKGMLSGWVDLFLELVILTYLSVSNSGLSRLLSDYLVDSIWRYWPISLFLQHNELTASLCCYLPISFFFSTQWADCLALLLLAYISLLFNTMSWLPRSVATCLYLSSFQHIELTHWATTQPHNTSRIALSRIALTIGDQALTVFSAAGRMQTVCFPAARASVQLQDQARPARLPQDPKSKKCLPALAVQ